MHSEAEPMDDPATSQRAEEKGGDQGWRDWKDGLVTSYSKADPGPGIRNWAS